MAYQIIPIFVTTEQFARIGTERTKRRAPPTSGRLTRRNIVPFRACDPPLLIGASSQSFYLGGSPDEFVAAF
jgi:hypothetical protein